MTFAALPEITVSRRRDRLDPINERRLHRAVETGEWVRVASGAYVNGEEWGALRPIEQHRVRVSETLYRMQPGAVVSHRSAAAVHGIDILGSWPHTIDVTIEHARGGRSTGGVRRHVLGLEGVEREPYGVHEITTPRQTALDLAASLPFVAAVTAVDQALWTGRDGGRLTTLEAILDLMARRGARRTDARVRRVLDHARPESSNVRETQNFLVVQSLGFPRPIVQYRRVLRTGRLAIADLYFDEEDHWCEIDGRGKYLSPEFGADRSPAAIVIDEKNRENEIRREVSGFSRWEALLADRPRELYDVLTADGLHSRRPRP